MISYRYCVIVCYSHNIALVGLVGGTLAVWDTPHPQAKVDLQASRGEGRFVLDTVIP